MEYLGVLAFVIVLCYMSYPDKVKKLEKEINFAEKIEFECHVMD